MPEHDLYKAFGGGWVVEHVGLDIFGNLLRVLIGPFAEREDAEAEAARDERGASVVCYLNPPKVPDAR